MTTVDSWSILGIYNILDKQRLCRKPFTNYIVTWVLSRPGLGAIVSDYIMPKAFLPAGVTILESIVTWQSQCSCFLLIKLYIWLPSISYNLPPAYWSTKHDSWFSRAASQLVTWPTCHTVNSSKSQLITVNSSNDQLVTRSSRHIV